MISRSTAAVTRIAAALWLVTATTACPPRTEILGEDRRDAGGQMGEPDGGYPQMMPPAGRGGAGAASMMEPDPMMMEPDPMTMEPDPMMGPVQDCTAPITGAVRKVAVALDRSCAALDTGELYCWGRDIVETTATTTPARVEGLMGAVEDVAVGASHVCALIGGAVWCWGDGSGGRLGVDSPQSTYVRREPQPVPGIDGAVVGIAAGFAHTCAVLEDGRVACWGLNDPRQIGEGDEVIAEPTIVWDRERALSVTAGFSHTCFIDVNQRSHCWGDNTFGQLGNGTNQRSTDPVLNDISTLSLSAGFQHTCAVETTGDVFCWGSNGTGQLGDGTTGGPIGDGMPTGRTSPVRVVGLSGAVSVHAAFDHTCAILAMGNVQCWGGNQLGALGYGSGEEIGQYKVEPVPAALLDRPVAQLATGSSHNCALYADGALVCWGDNQAGQLGDGTTDTDPSYAPVRVAGLGCP